MFSSQRQGRVHRPSRFGKFAFVWLAGWLAVGGHFLWSALASNSPPPPDNLCRVTAESHVVHKAIQDIRPGDTVYAYNFETSRLVPRKVYKVHEHYTRCWIDIRIGEELITATRQHPIWVESEGTWFDAIDLQVGMQVRLASGQLGKVTDIQIRELDKPELTYNFEVEGDHNYFVGTGNLLVHNGTPHDTQGFWNYWLTNADGETYYHGMAGPDEDVNGVKYRHSHNHDRFNEANGDRLVREPGERSYGDSRRMEHERIIRDKTNIGRDPNTYRGNRQSGISQRNLKNYYDGC